MYIESELNNYCFVSGNPAEGGTHIYFIDMVCAALMTPSFKACGCCSRSCGTQIAQIVKIYWLLDRFQCLAPLSISDWQAEWLHGSSGRLDSQPPPGGSCWSCDRTTEGALHQYLSSASILHFECHYPLHSTAKGKYTLITYRFIVIKHEIHRLNICHLSWWQ